MKASAVHTQLKKLTAHLADEKLLGLLRLPSGAMSDEGIAQRDKLDSLVRQLGAVAEMLEAFGAADRSSGSTARIHDTVHECVAAKVDVPHSWLEKCIRCQTKEFCAQGSFNMALACFTLEGSQEVVEEVKKQTLPVTVPTTIASLPKAFGLPLQTTARLRKLIPRTIGARLILQRRVCFRAALTRGS